MSLILTGYPVCHTFCQTKLSLVNDHPMSADDEWITPSYGGNRTDWAL